MKLARPDIFHPRVVLATDSGRCADDDDDDRTPDAGLIDALRARGVHARLLAWDDPQTLDADLVILRSAGGQPGRQAEFTAWTKQIPHLLNPAEAVAWNADERYRAELRCDGVPTANAVKPTDLTTLVFFGGGRSHAFGASGMDPDFAFWDVGRAALRAAAERLSIRIEDLLYARADLTGTVADARLVSLDLVAPQFGFDELDCDERDRAQRRFAVEVSSALERFGLGPLSQRRP